MPEFWIATSGSVAAELLAGTGSPSAVARLGAACLIALGLTIGAVAHAAPERNVLVISGRDSEQPAHVQFMAGFRSAIGSDGSPLELFTEFLDSARFPPPDGSDRMLRLLEDKYKATRLDLVIALNPSALQFVLEHRSTLFPRVPVIFALVSKEELPSGPLPEDVIGILDRFDLVKTVAMARGLQPTARRAVIVSGVDALDKTWEGFARKDLGPVLAGLEVTYLSGLPMQELLSRLARLPPDTIVVCLSVYRDSNGATYRPPDVASSVAAAATAPTYGLFPSYFGRGIVGGYMSSFEVSGEQTAALALRVLAGATPDQLRVNPSPPGAYLADWRQLRRWNISERLLPAETIVRFREPTAWDKYGVEISIGIALLVLQTVLIASLLLERRSRRRTSMALEESQNRMNLAVRAARLSVWIWDASGGSDNAAAPVAQHARQNSERAVAFDSVLTATHPADREIVERAVRNAIATGEELDIEYRVVDPDGNLRWVAAHGRAEKGNAHRLIGVALDVTERKAADLQAVEDRTALRHMTRVATAGQLSAAIAHQLNQPLAAILGNAEAAQKMLARDTIDLPELREILGDIVREDNRAAEVIRRLNALYKRGDMTTGPVDLNELIHETLDLLQPELLIRHVAPVTDLAPELPMVDGGRVQLQQVLLNLILNAADAMGKIKIEERKLTIRTEATGALVRLYVADNGSGIVADDRKNVFEAFWTTKPGGMGMGLAICKSIVAAHRGSITAANNPTSGATFCVSLPVSESA